MAKRRLPPMPPGGYDLADTDVEAAPPKQTALKEFVSADGSDSAMHDYMLGDDDQFVTYIPYKAPVTDGPTGPGSPSPPNRRELQAEDQVTMQPTPPPQAPSQRRPRPIDAPSGKAEAGLFDTHVDAAAALDAQQHVTTSLKRGTRTQ